MSSPWWLLPLSFVAGLLGGGPMNSAAFTGIVSSVYVIAALFIIWRWVRWDAAERKAKVSWLLQAMLIAFTVFALPYYFFRSRGWFGGARLLGLAWLIFIGAMLCYRWGYAAGGAIG